MNDPYELAMFDISNSLLLLPHWVQGSIVGIVCVIFLWRFIPSLVYRVIHFSNERARARAEANRPDN